MRRHKHRACCHSPIAPSQSVFSYLLSLCHRLPLMSFFRQLKAAPEQKVSQLTIKLRNVMMQLRKCCSHPFLLEHPLDKKTGELSLDERIVSQSGKMLILDRMLKELQRRQHKVERNTCFIIAPVFITACR